MEDELDPDTYGDDFSESGHYASASNDQEDDEQHAQKVITDWKFCEIVFYHRDRGTNMNKQLHNFS
jgi:hypothetical protein